MCVHPAPEKKKKKNSVIDMSVANRLSGCIETKMGKQFYLLLSLIMFSLFFSFFSNCG